MLRTTLKSLAARRFRVLLTATAIVLGVAFVTGALVLTDTATELFDDQFAEASSGVDLVVRDAATFGAAMGVEVERDPVTAETLRTIRAAEGVAAAEGIVRGSALLVIDGEPVVPSGPSIAQSWVDEPFGAFRIAVGRDPQRAGEIAIDRATADAHGVAVGDRVGVSLVDGQQEAEVVGIVVFGDAPGIPSATVVLLPVAVAQSSFGLGAGYSEVQVVADGLAAGELRDRLAAALGEGFEVASSQDVAAASADAAKEQLRFLRTMLLVLAATSLIVGAFMIANTFAIVVAQRTREFATLRALGATGRQITRSVVTEAAIVGLLSSALGVVVGIAAAVGLRRVAGAFGTTIPEGPMTVAPRTLLLGVAIGVTITLASALVPARRAARVSPVAAMRDVDVVLRGVSRRRIVVGISSGAVGVALAAHGAASASVPAAGGATVVAMVAAVVLAPAFAGRLAAVLGRPLPGMPAELARRNLRRSTRRTATTASALAIGLAMVTFMTVVATSVKAAVGAGLDDVVEAELILESARGEMLGGLSPRIHEVVKDVPGVEVTSRLRFGHWQHEGATKALTAVEPGTLPQVADLTMLSGDLAELDGGGVVLSDSIAAGHGLRVGDRLAMTFSRTGEQDMEVVGIFDADDAVAVSTGYLVSFDTFVEHFAEQHDATVYVKVADGFDVETVQAAVEQALDGFPTASVHDHAAARAAETAMIDSVLGLVTVLLLFAVGIALLGITNALALSIAERTREVGMLRAVGMTRRQTKRMVRTEAGLTAAVGAVIGIALGIVCGGVVVEGLAEQLVMDVRIPVLQLATYVLVAVGGGLVAGFGPARRAARLDVLAAVSAA